VQATRQRILEILRVTGPATVDDLSRQLALTPVTVRHHLDILRDGGLVQPCEVRRRATPGRPRHVYGLTEAAAAYFPNNYSGLVEAILDRIRSQFAPPWVNAFFEGIGQDVAATAPPPAPGETLPEHLDRATIFLSEKGYMARWERCGEGYLLHTCNCPYREIAMGHSELCALDFRLVAELMRGVPVQRVCRLVEGASSCAYLIPDSEPAAA